MDKLYYRQFVFLGPRQGAALKLQKIARCFGVRGWCMDTESFSLIGRIEGSLFNITAMIIWLEVTHPSRIHRLVLNDAKEIPSYTLTDFIVTFRRRCDES